MLLFNSDIMKQLKLDEFYKIDNNFAYNNLELTNICTRVYHELNGKKIDKIIAEFYPYSNIKLTVNPRKGKVLIRMADILSTAPKDVIISAANIIISRYMNIKCGDDYRALYREYIYSEDIRIKVRGIRRARARRRSFNPKGNFFDLEECFNNINSKYFNGSLKMPTLTWSNKRTKSSVGHYDMDLDVLVISKKLDTKKTPKYVVEFVVYHELLHQLYPGRYISGQWQVHTPEFKRSEKLFEKFDLANNWLKKR